MKRDSIVIIIRPSTRDKDRPLTAYISGTQLEGIGHTVDQAIEDLFSSRAAGKVRTQFEQFVQSYFAVAERRTR